MSDTEKEGGGNIGPQLHRIVERARSFGSTSSPSALAADLVLDIAQVMAAVAPGDPAAAEASRAALKNFGRLRFGSPAVRNQAMRVEEVLRGLWRFVSFRRDPDGKGTE